MSDTLVGKLILFPESLHRAFPCQERCLFRCLFSQQVVAGSWNILCVMVHTQQEGKMHHSLLVLYTPKVGVLCLTSPWWPSISAGEIFLEHVCFRITCWFDSPKQLSRVKKFHRVYSLEVLWLWGFNVFFKGILQFFWKHIRKVDPGYKLCSRGLGRKRWMVKKDVVPIIDGWKL